MLNKDKTYQTKNRNLYKNIIKILKISIGVTIAILFADYLGLKYSTSAGVIVLLTIVDTAKETIRITARRVVAFLLAMVTSFIVFEVIGYQVYALGIFLIIFLASCYYFKITDAIAMNTVLVTHYLVEGTMNPEIILNETLLLLIGAGIGTVLNLYIPSDVKYIRHGQKVIEGDLRAVLSKMSFYLLKEEKSEFTDLCFEVLEQHIHAGITYAYTNMKNTLFQESRYFVEYMEMRKQQSHMLHQIFYKIKELDIVPVQAKEISEFLKDISDSFSESNNVKHLLEQLDIIYQNMEHSPLPIARKEFENRAILYMILKEIELFLKCKEEFVEELSEEQKKKYWGS